MKNYWITKTQPIYSNELGREVYAIMQIEDEDTKTRYPQSYLNAMSMFKIPAGYMVPFTCYDMEDKYGNILDFITIRELKIIDKYGNSIGVFLIDSLFNLCCSLEFAKKNEWD